MNFKLPQTGTIDLRLFTYIIDLPQAHRGLEKVKYGQMSYCLTGGWGFSLDGNQAQIVAPGLAYHAKTLTESPYYKFMPKAIHPTDYLVEFYASGNKLKFDLESLKIGKTLKDLDISRNLVFGKLPKDVAGLRMLNVSHNHLCGQLPATKFTGSAFVGNDCLCGSPLPACKA
ncbi:hypothetical protein LIER_04818 [Lithospermum erythrorhizon]|uniref:Uncharacterized protein n=1 Tax=Lithospermum erythrorhizon TaxID=34254 RepID=A0AAV3NZF7_LITER